MINRFNIDKISRKISSDNSSDGFLLNTLTGFKISHTMPYRTTFYGIGLVHDGKMKLYTDLKENFIEGYSIIAIGPEVIKQWQPYQDKFKVETIFFTEEFLQKNNNDLFFLKKLNFFNCNGNHVFPIDKDLFLRVKSIFDQINVLSNETHSEKLSMIKHLIMLLILETKLLNSKAELINNSNKSHAFLTQKFKDLVTTHFRKERGMGFYAEQLFLNSKYLSGIIKSQTGKTGKEWINDMVILESKALLNNNNVNISQVADELNFVDSNVFGKYFKKSTGKTPNEYRNSIGRE